MFSKKIKIDLYNRHFVFFENRKNEIGQNKPAVRIGGLWRIIL